MIIIKKQSFIFSIDLKEADFNIKILETNRDLSTVLEIIYDEDEKEVFII